MHPQGVTDDHWHTNQPFEDFGERSGGGRRPSDQNIGPGFELTKQHSSSSDKNTISPDTFTENFTRSAVDDVKKWWCSQIELDSSDDDFDYEFVRWSEVECCTESSLKINAHKSSH